MRAVYIHLDGQEYTCTILREAGGIVFVRFTEQKPPQLTDELAVPACYVRKL
jgi:hypothetical protein